MIRNGSALVGKPGVGAQIDRSHSATRGLKACWLFNENSGNMLYDLAGQAHFTLAGGVGRTAGPWGPAIKLDGLSGQGVAPVHPLASATALTVILQARQKEGLNNPFGPYLGSEQNYNSGLYIGQNTPAVMQFWTGGVNLNVPTAANDTWGHYAFTWDGASGLKYGYTNGLQSAALTGMFVTIPAYTQAYIGKASAAGGGYLTDSALGCMKVWNRMLSPAEIMADYLAPWAMLRPADMRRFYSVPPVVGGGSGGGRGSGLAISQQMSIEI